MVWNAGSIIGLIFSLLVRSRLKEYKKKYEVNEWKGILAVANKLSIAGIIVNGISLLIFAGWLFCYVIGVVIKLVISIFQSA